MVNTDSTEKLRAAWGKTPLDFDHWLVEPGDVRYDFPSLESLLDQLLIRNQVRVRLSPNQPGGETLSRQGQMLKDNFRFAGVLEQTLQDQNLHVQTIHMECLGGEYQDFVDRFTGFVSGLEGTSAQSGLTIQAGFFIASPGAVVRFHADGSHNFLIHLTGAKQGHIFPNDDARIVTDDMRERIFGGGDRYLDYSPDLESTAFISDLKPSMSCYIPPLSAHWFESAPEITVSLAVSISTREEERLKKIHTMNRRLRSWGVNPVAVGTSPRGDSVKEVAERVFESGYGSLKKLRASMRSTAV